MSESKEKARPPHPDDWKPNKGPQERFLSLTCFEALYGGSAGGGKSDAILVDAVRYVGRGYGPAYQALLLRRTFPALEKSLIGRSRELYTRIGGKYRDDKKVWTFPGGESVFFGYLEHENDVEQYQGGAFPFIGFDELTQFSLAQYLYLFSRCRSGKVPCRIRGTTNPGGTGHEWVFDRFGPWLNPNNDLKAAPGEVLYFVKKNGEDVCVSKGTLDHRGTPAIGRVFVPAKLDDNPYLANDGAYARALEELDPVTQAQLKDGNWLIKPGAGLYFKGSWVTYIDEPPPGLSWVRSWDLAATPKTKENDPDWTQGVLGALWGNKIVIADLKSLQGDPGDVEDAIVSTADMDGKSVRIRLPQDPAQAGKSQAFNFSKLLRGYTFRTKVNTGDKVTRFGPFSSQAKQGNVVLVRGRWNARLVSELEGFPDGKKDIADAISDLYDELLHLPKRTGASPPVHTSSFEESSIG